MERNIKQKNGSKMATGKLFLILGVIPSILFLALVTLSLSWMQDVNIANSVQADLNTVYNMFYGELYQEAKLVNVLIDPLAADKDIQKAFLAGDRRHLQEIAAPLFHDLRTRHNITHLYFISPDRTTFLRVHHFEHFGDLIDRYTLTTAEQTGETNYGLELGPMGSLTLRVVSPWWIAGKLAGYIELGIEAHHPLLETEKTINVDLVLAVDKKLIIRKEWEEWLKITSRPGNWAQFQDSLVISPTFNKLPAQISKDISLPHHEHQGKLLEFMLEDRHYIAGFTPLLDAADTDIGDIIIIKDFTEMKSVAKNLTLFVLAGYFFCVLLYMVFIFIYSRRITHEIKRLLAPESSAE